MTIFSLHHVNAIFVRNFTTTSLSIAEILLFIKGGRKLPSPTLPIMHNAYLCLANIDVSIKHLRNFGINKNKMVISREDRMLIKVLHQEKGYGSKKLSAEFPNRAFELI